MSKWNVLGILEHDKQIYWILGYLLTYKMFKKMHDISLDAAHALIQNDHFQHYFAQFPGVSQCCIEESEVAS